MPQHNRIPLVSVCVPTIGRMAYLPRALEALSSQAFDDYEVLILDNAAPADAREYIQQYADTDSRVRVLRSDVRVHMFANFARGVVAARGKYLAFCHDDDIYQPTYLAAYASFMESHPRVGALGGNSVIVDEQGQAKRTRNYILRTECWSGSRYAKALTRLGVNVFSMSTVMFRTSALRPDTFNETMPVHASDYAILMRIGEQFDIGVHAEPLVAVREHAGQASRGREALAIEEIKYRILEDYCRGRAVRAPGDAALVDALIRNIDRSKRAAVIRAWLISSSEVEATESLNRLGRGFVDRLARVILRALPKIGVSANARRAWAPALSHIVARQRARAVLSGKS